MNGLEESEMVVVKSHAATGAAPPLEPDSHHYHFLERIDYAPLAYLTTTLPAMSLPPLSP